MGGLKGRPEAKVGWEGNRCGSNLPRRSAEKLMSDGELLCITDYIKTTKFENDKHNYIFDLAFHADFMNIMDIDVCLF